MLTIKDVLNKFADSEGDLVVTTFSGSARLIRTTTFLCPLQAATHPINYSLRASILGLSLQDTSAIVLWADIGRWFIDYNPFQKENSNDSTSQ